MSVDILIFAVIAAILIYRLNSVLGTRNGDEDQRPNPFDGQQQPNDPFAKQKAKTADAARAAPVCANAIGEGLTKIPAKKSAGAELIDAAANADGQVTAGLEEIAAVDRNFDAEHFMAGAEYAFGLIVDSYAKGDRAALKPLLSPKLYADFDRGIAARESAAPSASAPAVRNIKSARITEAHLGGTMAYVTVEYHVAQTSLTDPAAAEVEVTDIWTFTRDTRSNDPNWILIETRTTEK